MYPGCARLFLSWTGFSICIAPYLELMLNEIRQCRDCSAHRIEKLIELWGAHSMSCCALSFIRSFSPFMIGRFSNAFRGVTISEVFNPRAFQKESLSDDHQRESHPVSPSSPSSLPRSSPSQSNPLPSSQPSHVPSQRQFNSQQFSSQQQLNSQLASFQPLLPPAGLLSEVYEKQRRFGEEPYTPVTNYDLNEAHRNKDSYDFITDCDMLLKNVEEGHLNSEEKPRPFEEETIPRGELVFPEETSHSQHRRSHDHGRRSHSRY